MVCVEKCCCLFSLRAGVIFIGIVSFIIGTTFGILGNLLINSHKEYFEEKEKGFPIFSLLLIDIASILLLVGAIKRYHYLLIVWMVVAALAGLILLLVAWVVSLVRIKYPDDKYLLTIEIILYLIIVPGIYAFIIVVSLYQEIDQDLRRARMPPPPVNPNPPV